MNRRNFLSSLALAAPSLAQRSDAGFLKKVTFEERPALAFSNDKLELTVMSQGGAMANLVLRGAAEPMSPFWNPMRMAREAGEPQRFGASLGHFVCVDGFGPVSAEEKAAGMPGHGEAHVQPWEVKYSSKEGNTATVTFQAELPLVQQTFSRTLRMVDGENLIYVETELQSHLAFDHPVCWAEHATIGSPFLQPGMTVVDMPAKRARTRPYEGEQGGLAHRLPSGKDFTWPSAPGVKHGKIDLREAPREGGTGDHTTCLMDPGRDLVFVTALNPEHRLMLGYLFHREQYPWTQNWEFYPTNWKWARGLEFSTQPFDVPRREVVQMNSLFDTPVYRWLPAKSKIGSRFLLFYTQTPEGMRKVDDVQMRGGELVITDHKAAKQVTLRASIPI